MNRPQAMHGRCGASRLRHSAAYRLNYSHDTPLPPHHPLAAKLKVNNQMKTTAREPLETCKPFTVVEQTDKAKHTVSFYRLSIYECR